MRNSDDQSPNQTPLLGVNHITLSVRSLDCALDFYHNLLGARLYVTWDGGAYLTVGNLWLCLNVGQPAPAGDGSHFALDIRPEDIESFIMQLRSAGVREWKKNTSEGLSIYVLDPDGHKLEIHSGSLNSRLKQLESTPYQGIKWIDEGCLR